MTGTIDSEWKKIQLNCNGVPLPALIRLESGNTGGLIRFQTEVERDFFLEKEWLDSLDDDEVTSSD